MTEMIDFQVANNSWQLVADGSENVTVTTEAMDRFSVHVAQSQPSSPTPRIVGGHNQPVSFSGLSPSDKVYVQALRDPLKVTVTRG
ncbi:MULTISPECIES: hypothetical protein [unclassified Roseibium]|uniref:hypothetical protein n=1 Tax=unclassified Roseibium TaxID=2629323 RepID=UPI00273DA426|nr:MULTISPECIES: hypothetical protein [unclassified Roseibium]